MRALLSLILILTGCATRYASLAAKDVVAVAKVPVKEWSQVAVVTGVTAATLLADDEIARIVRNNDSPVLDRFADAVEPFGGGHSDKVIAGFFLYGIAARNERARAVAFDSFVSSIIASKAITPALKQGIHRSRPNGEDDESFPSNHATQSFAVATVIATHYGDRRWVRWLAYGTATSVAFARVQHDDHWTSDVIAGAAIGALVGRTVARTNISERKKWSVTPLVAGNTFGFVIRTH